MFQTKQSAYEDSDEEAVIYNNYAADNDNQMSGWEDVPTNGNFTEYASCDVILSICDSEQKENVDSENSENDEETENAFKKETFQEAVYSLNILKMNFLSHDVDDVLTTLETTDKGLWKFKTKQY